MIVRELITKLGFNFDDSDYNKFNKATYDIKKSLIKLNFSFNYLKEKAKSYNISATSGLESLSKSTSKSVGDLSKVSKQINNGVNDLKQLKEKVKNLEEGGKPSSNKFENFTDYLKQAATYYLGLTAGAASMIALASATARSVDELTRLSRQTNVNIRDLQLLEGIAQKSGARVGEFSKSFADFANNIRLTGYAAFKTESKLFAELGVALKDSTGAFRNTFDIYTDTVKKINAIGDSTKKTIYATTLLKTNNLKLLETFGSNREVLYKYANEFEKLGYVIDEKGVATTDKFIKSMNNFKIILKSLSTELSIQFMPSVSKLSDKFADWYSINRKIIKSGIETFVNTLSVSFNVLFSILNVVSNITLSVVNHFGGLENTVQILTAAFSLALIPKLYEITKLLGAFAFAMATGKAAIVAISLAVGVLVNDIYHWVKGNESAIGLVLGSWKNFKASFFGIVDSMTGYFVNKFKSAFGWFKDTIYGMFLEPVIEDFSAIKGWVNSTRSGANNSLKNNTLNAPPLPSLPNILNLPTPSNKTNNTSNNTVNFTIENITVGSSSPEEAREVSRLIFEDLEQKMSAQWVRGINAFG